MKRLHIKTIVTGAILVLGALPAGICDPIPAGMPGEQPDYGGYHPSPDGPEWPESQWLHNARGKGHDVPPPFSPLKTTDNSVAVWGRTFTFGGNGFPEQIVNQGQQMLVKPAAITVETEDGTRRVLSSGTLSRQDDYEDTVTFIGTSMIEGLTITTRTTVGFAGVMTCELELEGTVAVKRVCLDMPFSSRVGPYFHDMFRGYSTEKMKATWGVIDRPRCFGGFGLVGKSYHSPGFALSGEDLWMEWRVDTGDLWRIADPERMLEVIPDTGMLTFRQNFIEAPAAPVGKRRITFVMMFGPYRPMLKNARQYELVWWEAQEPVHARYIRQMGLIPMVLPWPFTTNPDVCLRYTDRNAGFTEGFRKANADPARFQRVSRKYFNLPVPEHAAGFQDWLLETQAAGGCVLPYIVWTFDLTWLQLETVGEGKYREEWLGGEAPPKPPTPIVGKPNDASWPTYPGCWYSQSFQDYYVYHCARLMEKYGFGGYYCDNFATGRCCNNPAHADHQPVTDEFGRQWLRVPIREAWSMHKRFYRAIKHVNPNAILFGNGNSPFQDFVFAPEFVASSLLPKDPNAVRVEDLRSGMFRGHQRGVQVGALGAFTAPFGLGLLLQADSTTQMLGAGWNGMNTGQGSDAILKIKSRFKIWEAEWIPYWKSEAFISIDPVGCYASTYRRDNQALIFISNFTDDAVKAGVSVEPSRLFGPAIRTLTAQEALSDAPIPMTASMVEDLGAFEARSIAIPARDYRAVLIKAE